MSLTWFSVGHASDCKHQLNPPNNSMMFFDSSATLSFETIRSTTFSEPYQAKALGLTRDALWIKTQFDPQQACPSNSWYLQFQNPFLDFIDVYMLQGDTLIKHDQLGDRREPLVDALPRRLPSLKIKDLHSSDLAQTTQPIDIYIRLASQNSINTHLSFVSEQSILEQEQPIIIMSAFIGAALVLLLLFSLILLAITYQTAVIYYIILLVSYSYILATVYGWLHLWSIPSDPWVLIAQPLVILSFLLLSNAVLGIKNSYKRTYILLMSLAIFLVIFSLLSSFFDHLQPAIKTVHIMGVFILIGLLVMSSLMVKNNTIAKFYFLVFGVMIVALIIRILAIYNFVPANFFLAHLFSFMILFQLIILFFVTLSYFYQRYLNLLQQQQQLQMEQQLLDQRKLFLRLLSHEFMTPLAIGSAVTRNLADDLADLNRENVAPHIIRQMQKDLQTQERARQRLQDLVNQCLEADFEVNRFEDGRTSLAKFSQAFYQSLNKIEQRPRLVINWLFKPEDIDTDTIKGDAEPLIMAINMIVNNALKYSPADQSVIITLALEGAQLTIAVRDYGIGFDLDKDILKAFKRGRNTQNTSGLGLGLFISQDILQRYQGELTIEPQQPGSLVSLSIPLDSELKATSKCC